MASRIWKSSARFWALFHQAVFCGSSSFAIMGVLYQIRLTAVR